MHKHIYAKRKPVALAESRECFILSSNICWELQPVGRQSCLAQVWLVGRGKVPCLVGGDIVTIKGSPVSERLPVENWSKSLTFSSFCVSIHFRRYAFVETSAVPCQWIALLKASLEKAPSILACKASTERERKECQPRCPLHSWGYQISGFIPGASYLHSGFYIGVKDKKLCSFKI